MNSLDTLKEYVEKKNKVKELEAEVKKIKGEMSDILDNSLAFFTDNEVPSIKVCGRTAYLAKDRYAAFKEEGIDRDHAIAVLQKSGMPEYAKETINWQGLSARLREMIDSGDLEIGDDGEPLLPEGIRDVFRVSTKYKINVRKD